VAREQVGLVGPYNNTVVFTIHSGLTGFTAAVWGIGNIIGAMLESVDWGAVCLERPVLIEPLDKCLGLRSW